MKTKALFLLLAIMVVTVAAVAADGAGKFVVRDQVQMNGKPLAAGEYKITWQGNGNKVDITVLKNNKPVATTTAKVTELEAPAPYDSVMLRTEGNNKNLTEIRFGGKKSAIVFE